jgi:hypothetical protein
MRRRYLTRVNYSLHEAGHICGALHRHIRCDAALVPVMTDLGECAAMSYHYGGNVRNDLFILACGIAASRYFQLGEAGLRKDHHDIAAFDAAPLTKKQAQRRADEYVAANVDIILRMAYKLCELGVLDQSATQGIFDGTIPVTVSQEFLAAVADIPNFDWRAPRNQKRRKPDVVQVIGIRVCAAAGSASG